MEEKPFNVIPGTTNQLQHMPWPIVSIRSLYGAIPGHSAGDMENTKLLKLTTTIQQQKSKNESP